MRRERTPPRATRGASLWSIHGSTHVALLLPRPMLSPLSPTWALHRSVVWSLNVTWGFVCLHNTLHRSIRAMCYQLHLPIPPTLRSWYLQGKITVKEQRNKVRTGVA